MGNVMVLSLVQAHYSGSCGSEVLGKEAEDGIPNLVTQSRAANFAAAVITSELGYVCILRRANQDGR